MGELLDLSESEEQTLLPAKTVKQEKPERLVHQDQKEKLACPDLLEPQEPQAQSEPTVQVENLDQAEKPEREEKLESQEKSERPELLEQSESEVLKVRPVSWEVQVKRRRAH